MTPTQKAKELVDKFGSKELAIMCVDEILNHINMYAGGLSPKWKFLNEVKQEI